MAYYVGDHFTRDNSAAKLKSVERAVEEDFVSNLRNNCWKEKQQSMSCAQIFEENHTLPQTLTFCYFLSFLSQINWVNDVIRHAIQLMQYIYSIF